MTIKNQKNNRKQRGSVAAEYVIAAVGIGLAMILGAGMVGAELRDRYTASTDALGNFIEANRPQ